MGHPWLKIGPLGYPPPTGTRQYGEAGPYQAAGYGHVDDRVSGCAHLCRVPGSTRFCAGYPGIDRGYGRGHLPRPRFLLWFGVTRASDPPIPFAVLGLNAVFCFAVQNRRACKTVSYVAANALS